MGGYKGSEIGWSSAVSNSLPLFGLEPARFLFCGFFRQEFWSGSSFPSPGDLPYPGMKPTSPVLQVDSLPTETLEKSKGEGRLY